MQKSVVQVTLTSIATLVVLVILVGLAGMLPVHNAYLSQILDFVNNYILVIIFFTLFFFVGEILYAFGLPFNVLGVIFYAYGAYFITFFIFKVFYLIESFIDVAIFSSFGYLEQLFCIAIFLVVLVVGISRIFSKKEDAEKSEDVEWKDIWGEFKGGMNNISKKFREKTEVKKVNDGKKKKK